MARNTVQTISCLCSSAETHLLASKLSILGHYTMKDVELN